MSASSIVTASRGYGVADGTGPLLLHDTAAPVTTAAAVTTTTTTATTATTAVTAGGFGKGFGAVSHTVIGTKLAIAGGTAAASTVVGFLLCTALVIGAGYLGYKAVQAVANLDKPDEAAA